MSDEIFRIVVAAGVVLASIAFVVQAGIVFAIYRVYPEDRGRDCHPHRSNETGNRESGTYAR